MCNTPRMMKRSVYVNVEEALDAARRDKRCDGVIARIGGSRFTLRRIKMRHTVDVMWSVSRSLFIAESDQGRKRGNMDREGITLGSKTTTAPVCIQEAVLGSTVPLLLDGGIYEVSCSGGDIVKMRTDKTTPNRIGGIWKSVLSSHFDYS
eukprot:GHVR01097653.1.p1 GENE.GHVR01097653.1~~GHVR01097653.1.p1  ORF type:complete len:168 (-),score=28.02 GHVR01097653.1:95-544(-)